MSISMNFLLVKIWENLTGKKKKLTNANLIIFVFQQKFMNFLWFIWLRNVKWKLFPHDENSQYTDTDFDL